MSDYATTEQIKAFAREADGLDSAEGWEILATAASRAIDAVCEVPEGFFAEASSEVEEKIFYGDGSSLVRLSPYRPGTYALEQSGINDEDEMPEGVIEKGEQGLQHLVLDGGHFEEGLKVRVSAAWGFDRVPADIQFAAVQLALLMWRQSDVSFASIANSDSNLILKELPPVVKAITDRYRRKYGHGGLFV